jgi:ligand-binding sensor domain-containing protein
MLSFLPVFIFGAALFIDAAGGPTTPSDNFQFEYITMRDRLSQSSINCILQDSVGFLWFGAQDGRLLTVP